MTMRPANYSCLKTPMLNSLLLVVFILFSTFQPVTADEIPKLFPAPSHRIKCNNIIQVLERYHYAQKDLNNALSSVILDRYIKRLDPGKRLFNAHDIAMIKQFKYRLDDELFRGNLNPAFQIFNLYLSRSVDRLNQTMALIKTWETDFDFTKNDTLIVDNDLRQWQMDYPSLRKSWNKDLKNHIITMLLDDKDHSTITSELEKLYTNRKKRMLQTNADDVFQIFMNAVASSFDPHTQYFPPRLAEDFDIHMSLSLEGIGAVLQSEYEYTKVVRLIPKGPADKSNLLMPGDKIIGVGQGKKGEIKDTIGLRIDSVVKLIRGPKNSIVRLKIIPAKQASVTKTIQIKREKVKLEDQSAQKNIITLNHENQKQKIGVIEFPSFYSDFTAQNRGDKNYRSVTRDVKRLLSELKKESIDGLIIDLRDNGGGSLQEAYELTGLFLKSGPIVQVRDKSQIMEHADDDPDVYYSGPLIVLINRMSASASEIFAGAIKDYHRGVIVGSRSFGKGTVQNMLGLDRKGDSKLKLTIAKFYRVSGDSTQHKGVLPDLSYPQFYKIDQTGESAQEGALLWDKIYKTSYDPYLPMDKINDALNKAYKLRSQEDPDLTYLTKRIELNDQINAQKTISLNLEQRKSRKKEYKQIELNIENTYLETIGKPVIKEITQETSAIKDFKKMIINQTHQVMSDLIAYSKKNKLSWQ